MRVVQDVGQPFPQCQSLLLLLLLLLLSFATFSTAPATPAFLLLLLLLLLLLPSLPVALVFEIAGVVAASFINTRVVWCAATSSAALTCQGANTSYSSKNTMPGGISEHDRRTFRSTNFLGDIEGSSTGTLK
jgi:hypothetical protein